MPSFALTAAPYVVSVVGLAYASSVFVQLTKFLLNYLSAPGTPNQNSIVRLYVFIVAAVVVCAVDFLSYHLATRTDVLNAVADAINVGAIAIASYHVLGSEALPTPPAMVGGLSAPEAAESTVETTPA